MFLVARREDRLQNLAAKLRRDFGVKVTVAKLDVRDRQAVVSFVQSHSVTLEKVSVLINNAGLAKGFDKIQDGNVDDWELMIDTNIKGLLYVTRAILPFFVAKNEGHIVQIGSVAGRWSYPKGNVYCATKSAVKMLNEAIRLDLNGTGIRITEVAPGMVETEFSEVRLGDSSKAKSVYSGTTPLSAEDVAEAVVWSVSRPKHVNIQEIVIYPTTQAAPGMVHRV